VTAVERPVIVVGGGWAGLSAAVTLAERGCPVKLLESAPQLGGRARGVRFGETMVDNGQHLLIGAYRHSLALMRRIGVEEEQAFLRRPMRLSLLSPTSPTVDLGLPAGLPAPMNLLWALARAGGLSRGERTAALRFALAMGLRRFRLDADRPLAELLARYRQPDSLVEKLWSPVCLATLNTPVGEASSLLFLNVLRDSFSRRAADAHLLMARRDLGALLPEPAADYLRARGGEVLTRHRVTRLVHHGERVTGVRCGKAVHEAERVILATPPQRAAELLRPLPGLSDVARRLADLESYPITTVYLRYPGTVSLPQPMLGLREGPGQWLMERRIHGQENLLSVVISGPGPHMETDRQALAGQVAEQVAALFPGLPEPTGHLVIRERHATFRATSGIQARRPEQYTALAGLWLAGDYTAGPYPATLEGAVLSGVQCARRILRGE
jgi:squalene-associated FAD-dependent desaturase